MPFQSMFKRTGLNVSPNNLICLFGYQHQGHYALYPSPVIVTSDQVVHLLIITAYRRLHVHYVPSTEARHLQGEQTAVRMVK